MLWSGGKQCTQALYYPPHGSPSQSLDTHAIRAVKPGVLVYLWTLDITDSGGLVYSGEVEPLERGTFSVLPQTPAHASTKQQARFAFVVISSWQQKLLQPKLCSRTATQLKAQRGMPTFAPPQPRPTSHWKSFILRQTWGAWLDCVVAPLDSSWRNLNATPSVIWCLGRLIIGKTEVLSPKDCGGTIILISKLYAPRRSFL